MKINVLGTEYELLESNRRLDAKLESCGDGYCDTSIKRCVVDDMQETGVQAKANLQEYKKSVIRHELIHAFLFESGMDACSRWANEEEMVDWLAIQAPKLMAAFKAAGAI